MEAEGRNPIYVSLEREGAIRIVSYSGKIEGSDSHAEGLRKIFRCCSEISEFSGNEFEFDENEFENKKEKITFSL